MVCLLMLNTILNQGSFTLEALRERNTELIHTKEALKQDVSYMSSPEVVAQKAKALGMVPSKETNFVSPKKSGESGAGKPPARRSGGE